MRIVRPLTITDAILASSDVPETEHPTWLVGAAYGTGVYVIRNHKRYESVQNSTGKDPELEPSYWLYLGPTNRWALLDAAIGTTTSKSGGFTYRFTITGAIDTVAFLNAQADSLGVQLLDENSEVLFEQTVNMIANAGITDIYAYLFEDIRRLTDKTIFNIPRHLGATLVVTVTRASGIASLGCLIIGKQRYIGRTQYGTSVGIIDFSKKEKDAFGNFKIVERPYSKRGSFNVMVDNSFIDELQWMLAGYRTTPILYLGTDEYESTSVYGFYKDFTLSIQDYSQTQCNIEVEGLT